MWKFVIALAAACAAGLALAAPVAAREAGETFRDCRECPEMIVLPAGQFHPGADRRAPAHVVSAPFAVSRFEITRGEYAAFVRLTGRESVAECDAPERRSALAAAAPWSDPGFSQADSHPVVCITWHDASDYVAWLNSFVEGGGYRLLTSEEWEYAARAGSDGPFPWGDEPSRRRANYGPDRGEPGLRGDGRAEGRDHWLETAPVGSFGPNDFGLYDMHGNAAEWTGACTDQNCALRGGGWRSSPAGLATPLALAAPAASARDDLGFRVARTLAN